MAASSSTLPSNDTGLDTVFFEDEGIIDHIGNFNLINNQEVHITTISLVAIGILIYVPFCIYIAYPLFIRRNDIILQKRYVSLSIIAVISLLIQIISLTAMQLFDFEVINDDDKETFFHHSLFTASGITECFYYYTEAVFVSVMGFRFWLIYYDTNYNIVLCHDEWKGVISESHNIASNNYFIKNKAKWGNKSFLMRFFIIDIFFGLIVTPMLVYHGYVWLIYIYMLISYIVFFFAYMKLRTFSFYDELHILEEFHILGVSISFVVLIWIVLIVAAVISLAIATKEMQNTLHFTVYMFLDYQVRIWYDMWLIYVLTRYVMKKLETDPAIQQQYFDKPQTKKGHQMVLSNELKAIKLDEMLKHNAHFTCFMQHLANEYSMELLLSLVEFIQFKQFIYEQIRNTENQVNDPFSKIILAEDIPQSSIVYDADDELKLKALKLYKKYVKEGSEFEINVAFAVRQQLRYEFEVRYHETDHNTNAEWSSIALYSLFDECCKEMMKLLRYSLSRFRTKPEYLRLQNLKK